MKLGFLLYFYKKEAIIIFLNKYSVAFVSALIVLTGAVLWREITKFNNDSQIIIVENPPETTIPQTAKTDGTIVKTTRNTKTTIISEKSTYPTKLTEKTTEISEVCTETEALYIDINNAGFDELIKLNGIGDYLAEQIITYREENGGFRNIEEILNISGIGEKTFESIRDCIYVENPVYYVEEVPDEPEPSVEIIEEITTEKTTEIPLTLEDYVPINLNEADIEVLILLPYVDEETAQNIIELRAEMTRFSHVYELLYVEGITEEMLIEIVKYIYV